MVQENLQNAIKKAADNKKVYAHDDITIYFLHTSTFSIVEKVWKYLSLKKSSLRLQQTWEWIDTWVKVYGDLVEYWFAVGVKDGQPIGITIITKEKFRKIPFPINAIHVGTYGESFTHQMDMLNNVLLIEDGLEERFISALVTGLTHIYKYEELVFDHYDRDYVHAVLNALAAKNVSVHIEKDPTRYFDFTKIKKSDDLLTHFSSSMRHNIRRSLKAFDDLELEWAEDGTKGKHIFDELVTMYQAAWKKLGRDGIFASPYYKTFQKNLIKALIDKDMIVLFRVRSKKHGILGCFYFIVDDGIAYFIQIGIRDFTDAELETISKNRLKIGYMIHYLCMEECRKRGLKGYNFSTGVYGYKMQLTNAEKEVITVSIRRSFKPALRDTIMETYAKLDEQKQTPLVLKVVRAVFKR